jgi:Raf kinase inhibitor-like YbhB/YbcL family protein
MNKLVLIAVLSGLACSSSRSSSATGGVDGDSGMSGGGGKLSGGAGGDLGGAAGGGISGRPDSAADSVVSGGDDGGEIDLASSDLVAMDVTSSDVKLGDGPVASGPFSLTSSAFQDNGVIDPKYRCRTANVSPPLSWTPGPAGTQSYAITMNHNAALHWLLWDIPATTMSLPEAIARMAMPAIPIGSRQNKTSTDGATWYGYTGPCPGGTTSGGSFTNYPFTVYALRVATLPGVTPESSSAQIKAAIDAASLPMGKATLTAMAGGGK